MIPEDYLLDKDLMKGWMVVEKCANGWSDEAFLGDMASCRPDGSFHKDKLSQSARDRFVADGYIEPVPNCPGWYRKAVHHEQGRMNDGSQEHDTSVTDKEEGSQ